MKTKILGLFFLVAWGMGNPLYAFINNTPACNLNPHTTVCKQKCCHSECSKAPAAGLTEHSRTIEPYKKTSGRPFAK